MKLIDINIRDPFVLYEDSKYYLYGTRAKNFGQHVGGFDVYISDDLSDFSEPHQCFDAEKYGLNKGVCWAPEIHKYNGCFYMLATFTGQSDLRGTYILKSDSPEGPFMPHSSKPLTPEGWECLDGTLYIDKAGKPYLVFCHEHTQIIDGTICYIKLKDDLTCAVSEPVELFAASQPYYIEREPEDGHYITDGPFMYRTKDEKLLLIWSTFINEKYAQCIAESDNGEITGNFTHLPPLITDDGGHGMIFKANDKLFLTYHSPNRTGFERPVFKELEDIGNTIILK